MRVSHSGSVGTISRGTFIRGVAGGLALAAVGEPFTRFRASAAGLEDEGGKIQPPLQVVAPERSRRRPQFQLTLSWTHLA
jgi:hypothetical protein